MDKAPEKSFALKEESEPEIPASLLPIKIWETDRESGKRDYVEVPYEIMLGKPAGPSQEECDFLANIFRTEKKRLEEKK